MGEKMISVENLSKNFKINKKYKGIGGTFRSFFSREYSIKQAVKNLSFTIEKGEMLGFIGLNGAGKSTTIKILAGLMTPTSGKCVVNGMIPYKERRRYTKNIGVVFGNRSQLWWDLPVSESFSVLRKIYEVPQNVFDQQLEMFMDILDLEEFYMTPVRNLSLGQKMRADLAASMLHNPSVLFLDEPTIGLDIIVKDRIRKAIKKINREFNTTVFLTTHDLDDIEQICSRIIMIDKGEKIFEGNFEEVNDKYATTRTVFFEFNNKNIVLKKEDLGEGILDISNNGEGKSSIKIARKEVDFPQMMTRIVGKYDVKDFTVEEPKLEDIIKGIYVEEDKSEK